ncbi:hypothetical protein TNIN_163391 [Trichonephila inaurata madagascariensis]|uniref:Uncharacterized protein n=1 Tax=Trichonephila inaurata madagascariensis TaxID=2747483 RepID=A0A8X7BX34_9ARAC|nr:hypothetical protein TNIN_163391 [Trichonephila inaurata madagascariensis]
MDSFLSCSLAASLVGLDSTPPILCCFHFSSSRHGLDLPDRTCLFSAASAPREGQGLDSLDWTCLSLAFSLLAIFLVDGLEGIEVGTVLFLYL